jgi:hypothetical protein
MLSDGSEPEGLKVKVDPPEVAHWAEGSLIADHPGTATVVVSWQGQAQEWKLDVRPSVILTLVSPPAELAVGQAHPLQVSSVPVVEPAALRWESSAPDVLQVEGGRATALSVGQAFVSVYHGSALAMAEVKVVAELSAGGAPPTPPAP